VLVLSSAAVVLLARYPDLARGALRALESRFPALFDTPVTPIGVTSAVALALVGSVGVVVVHECGHLAAGLLAGFRFTTIAIGPLRLDDRFRVSIHRGTLALSGGWVSMIPGTRHRLRERTLAVVAGGPLASLTAGAVALRFAGDGPASAAFIIGCLSGISDLLPIRAGAITFDGRRILSLLRNDAWSRRWLALMTAAADFRAGVAPEELPAADVEALAAFEDASADTSVAHAIAYTAAFHSGQDERAARRLETSLAYSGHVPPSFRAALVSDAAAFQARRRRRPDLAAGWARDVPPEAGWLRMRAEAAVLQAEGQLAAAAAKLDACEQALASLTLPSDAQRQMGLRLLRRWQTELAEAAVLEDAANPEGLRTV